MAVVTGFGRATAVADDGGLAKWILHFCTVVVSAVPGTCRGDASYCKDTPERPSLIPGLELSDKTRDAPFATRIGLPDRSTWSGRSTACAADRGSDGEAGSRASTKGAPRAAGVSSAAWLPGCESMSVAEVAVVCVDRGRGCDGSMMEAAPGGRGGCGRITRPNESCNTVTSVLGSEISVWMGEVLSGAGVER